MVQQWIDVDESVDLEQYFRSRDQQLREVALLDAVINNTDRKIGHLLPDKSGHLYICDHGVTFHVDDKLRTVLWQWAGESLQENEISALGKLLSALENNHSDELTTLITSDEYSALKQRTIDLLATRVFPHPNPEWPHIPWPPF
jgi:uncharacterized repeat protein (TIGR03843 family)